VKNALPPHSYTSTMCLSVARCGDLTTTNLTGPALSFFPWWGVPGGIYAAQPAFTIQFLGYGNNPWGSFSARLEVIWYDAFGNILSVVGFAINRSDNWTSYSYGVDAPAGAAYAKINLVKASWGYAAFDDISIASGCPNCAMGELSGKPVFVAGLTFRTLGDSIAADRQSPQTSNTIRQLNSGSILSCFRRVLP